MKKNTHFGRFLALALMLVMVVSLIPVGASATELWFGIYDKEDKDMSFNEAFSWPFDCKYKENDKAFSVNIQDYDRYVCPFLNWGDATVFEFVGMGSSTSDKKICNDVKAIDVPAYPINGTAEEQAKWHEAYDAILLAYMEHEHDLSTAPWCFDNNYHWKSCTKCKHRVFLEWHSDKNNDGICDACSNPIHYYNVTVKDTTGGKITVSKDKGAMNDVINVTVTPDAGYHLEQLHAYNSNAQHSELTRYEDTKGEAYHFVILNWDVELEAAFVKD